MESLDGEFGFSILGGGLNSEFKIAQSKFRSQCAALGGEAVGINADSHRCRDGVIAVDEGGQNGFETTAVQGILGVKTRRPASFAKESWRSSKERKRSA